VKAPLRRSEHLPTPFLHPFDTRWQGWAGATGVVRNAKTLDFPNGRDLSCAPQKSCACPPDPAVSAPSRCVILAELLAHCKQEIGSSIPPSGGGRYRHACAALEHRLQLQGKRRVPFPETPSRTRPASVGLVTSVRPDYLTTALCPRTEVE